MKPMAVPHPIPYQGSKRHLAQTILRYLPTDSYRLVEPFAGSAALSLAAASTRHVERFVLNDINIPLMMLWNQIINQPEHLAKYYEQLWQAQQGRERRYYDLVRTRFNRTHQPYYFLYLLARCVKAAVRYNANGEFNQSPDNRRKGRQPTAMRSDIQKASALLKGKAQLHAGDYRSVLAQVMPGDVVYLDPPYQGVCANRDPRYIEGIKGDEFITELEHLNQRQIAFILSYDGRTGNKTFGRPLPVSLDLLQIELNAGRSSQATLLGREVITYESLYLSPALVKRIQVILPPPIRIEQLPLFGETA